MPVIVGLSGGKRAVGPAPRSGALFLRDAGAKKCLYPCASNRVTLRILPAATVASGAQGHAHAGSDFIEMGTIAC